MSFRLGNFQISYVVVMALAVSAASLGCSSSDSGVMGPEAATSGPNLGGGGQVGGVGSQGSAGVGQAGAQDFGLFRKLLEAGQLPAPSTLDELGFFAEHKLDYPTAACGEDLCMHGLLGIMGNMITGSPCTLVHVGLNTPIDVDSLARPPMHLVLAIDTSGSMAGESMSLVKAGLIKMLDHLGAADTVSLVRYGSDVTTLLEHKGLDARAEIEGQIAALQPGGTTDLFGGLFQALSLAGKYAQQEIHSRVILLSDGVATAGLQNSAKLTSLAAGWARKGIGLTTIGLGADFDVEVMRALSEVGAGNFYFLEDAKAVAEVFTEEVKTMLFPIALDVTIQVTMGDGYLLGGAYGTRGWTATPTGGQIDIPTLFLARRTDAKDPIESGRRGGGGAIMIELIPLAGLANAALLDVGTLEIAWTHPKTGVRHTRKSVLHSTQGPGDLPAGGVFTHKTAEKGFVMLNLFVGLRLAAELAADSDPGAGIGVLQALRTAVQGWLKDNPDPDIADDLKYVGLFIDVLQAQPAQFQTPIAPASNPWPGGD